MTKEKRNGFQVSFLASEKIPVQLGRCFSFPSFSAAARFWYCEAVVVGCSSEQLKCLLISSRAVAFSQLLAEWYLLVHRKAFVLRVGGQRQPDRVVCWSNNWGGFASKSNWNLLAFTSCYSETNGTRTHALGLRLERQRSQELVRQYWAGYERVYLQA